MLLAFPTAVLIMFALGALVVDVSLTQLRARELEAAAGTAANDALAALDVAELRRGNGLVIDAASARAQAEESVRAGPLPEAQVVAVTVTVDPVGRTVISVTLRLHVDLVMAPAVGSLGEITLQRTERAVVLGSERL